MLARSPSRVSHERCEACRLGADSGPIEQMTGARTGRPRGAVRRRPPVRQRKSRRASTSRHRPGSTAGSQPSTGGRMHDHSASICTA